MKLFESIRHRPFWLVVVALFLAEAILTPADYFPSDRDCFLTWAGHLSARGIGSAYQIGTYNYPPLIAYPLWLFGKCFASEAALDRAFHFFKLFPLAFDFAAAAAIVSWAGIRRWEIAAFLLLAANPLFLYDSYYWGQVDAVMSGLVLFSLLAALNDRPVPAALLFLLAVNFKIQAIIFLPPMALVVWWKFRNPWRPVELLRAAGLTALRQLAILLPFILAGQIGRMAAVIGSSLGFYQVLSMHADNFWCLLYGSAAHQLPDNLVLRVGLTARQMGLLLFCGFSFAILGPFLWRLVAARRTGRLPVVSVDKLLLLFALISLGFFFFNTEMHERYSHPAIYFVAAYAFRTRRYVWLGLMLTAFVLNLESVFRHWQLISYQWPWFNPRVIGTLYAALITGLGYFYFCPDPPSPGTPAPVTAPQLPHPSLASRRRAERS